jgi:hypothetical protein
MRERATSLAVALALALAAAACGGGAETNVVNQYFTALRAGDTNTLTSFAMVQFDKPVEDYKVVSVGPETKSPAPLPDLVKKAAAVEAEQKANEKEYRAWGNDLAVYPKLDQMKAARAKGGKIPPALQAVADKYDGFQTKDRDLKKAVQEAKAAVEREKRNVGLSIGQVEDMETLTGDVISKDITLDLKVAGQTKPYQMTLRKYELTGGTGGRMVARWVVQTLQPKS